MVGIVVGLGLAGCASDDGGGGASASPSESQSAAEIQEFADVDIEAGASGRGLPDGVDQPESSAGGVAWSGDGAYLFVMTFGSSTCPMLGDGATAEGATVTVTFEPVSDGPCTMDYVPFTSVVAVPDSVDPMGAVTVELGDLGTLEVPPLTEKADAADAGEPVWLPAAG